MGRKFHLKMLINDENEIKEKYARESLKEIVDSRFYFSFLLN